MKRQDYLVRRKQQIDAQLERHLGPEQPSNRLHTAMRYSVLAPGKRVRPILALAACETVGGNAAEVLPFACAIELIHTYSLIHDDLPAMDDDDLRRGRPTCHKMFGEGIAILAGDALLTDAFRIMAEAALSKGARPKTALRVLSEIAAAAGSRGMVAGQAADMEAERVALDLPMVEYIHVRKTGELLRASIRAGALLGGATPKVLTSLTRYVDFLGLAFQVADDILDEEGVTAVTGKNTGRDRYRRKATFPSVMGLPAAKQRLRELREQALEQIADRGRRAEPLRQILQLIVDRACSPS
ncbi:MAG: polyprenyl synthetase family protein [Deltaproteobacteria bacterium]|nr:polyprenyl synthetase family protein [Deltaproteobacteria bacterium]